ncbi:phage head closure protein [Bacillus cereus]|uniref:phage head closure protein n=1 Tax=Bacillus cereus TaxID=1396 RepID=UPI000BF61AA7|nr:phage head closure protein [Bacillus cereus]MCU4862606.1 phage head closure protein [Bacillus cereus]MCU5146792.1 phage head closure protein [Bacillus cereus]MCU5491953.1 phage head closure protein [Bacillus cereus]PFD73788.1 phage head-tail adapter protein [Bacillus cereus]PFT86136.1 phage head-tail adapter protein [Bacillus cereus]
MNGIVFFPVVTTTTDDLGQIEVAEEFTRQVFCEKKSVSQNEFFQAGQNGFKPKCVLIVYTLDYQEEQKVQYHNKKYNIYRTYERDDERIELYCEVKTGG